MNYPHRLFSWKIPLLLASLVGLTLFILACGDDATPEPTAAPPPAAATVDISAITSDIKQTIQEEVGKIRPPLSEAEIRNLIESAVSTGVPEGVSAEEIQSMVDSAVAAAAAAAAPEPLSAMDIERIVKASIPTPAPVAMATPAPTAMAEKIPVEARLIIAIAPPADQFTMAHPHSQTSEKMMPIYEHLVGRHYQTNVEQPELATDWSVTPDGKVWTFNLRDDVPFYRNAQPTDMMFSAQDVVLAFNLVTGNLSDRTRSPGTWAGRLGTDESAWIVENSHRIRIELPKISLDVPFLVSEEWETGIPSKAWWDTVGGEDEYEADPIGNGPWSFIDLELNVNVLHERVEDHWRKTPEFHELEMLFVKEASTRLAQLITGEASVVNIPRTLRGQAEAAGMVTAKSTLPGSHTHLRIPYYQPQNFCPEGVPPPSGRECGPTPGYDPDDPMRNPKVRLVLNYAIDREAINDAFFLGEGFPEVDYFPPWREDFLDEWVPYPNKEGKTGREGGWPYPYDPEAAKQLLVEAGFPNGFETQLWFATTSRTVPEQGEIVETLKAQWEAIGIETRLVPFEGSLTRRARGADVSNWSFFAAPSLDPICVAPSFWWREGGVGYREWPEISAFKHACDATADPAERLRLAQEFGTWWLKDAISVPLLWIFNEGTINPNIVAEYKVNMLHMGPIRYHEYTVPVYQ